MSNNWEGYRSVVYFASWAIYQRNHTPQDLPVGQLTHVIYSFGDIRPESGEVFLSDAYSDTDKLFSTDIPDEPGTNLYGCIKQLNLLKKRNRQLKVLLSIGGMSNSTNFLPAVTTNAGRAMFVSTAVSLLKNHGFDGLDIDWEFPKTPKEAQALVSLLQECRQALDVYGKTLSPAYHFELTAASPAAYYYEKMDLKGMDQHVDFWNLMAYAFAGNWSAQTGHQTNLFNSRSNPLSTPYSADEAIKYYVSQGIRPSKIMLGMPTYGRAFENTTGLGQPYEGVGKGSWQIGVYDDKVLPLEGAEEFYDEEAGATYSYDKQEKILVSYDTVEMAQRKARWIMEQGLGGGMWWESSGDNHGNKSVIENVVMTLAGSKGDGMERGLNCLDYPDSIYENLKRGFPGE